MLPEFVRYLIDLGNAKWPSLLPEEPAVYVFALKKQHMDIPLYVGETNNLCRRMWNYKTKYYSAATDFSVGTALMYFKEHGYEITVHYKTEETFVSKASRVAKEFDLILDFLKKGNHLLNSFPRYNYREFGLKEKVIKDIEEYCQMIMKSAEVTS